MSVAKNRAWQELVDLSFDRVTGTEGEAKAAEYLKKACEDLGVKAEIEPYEIDTSDIHTAKLVTAGGKEYTVFGIAHSGSTPAEGITAPLAYAGEGKLDTDFIDIKGKIVLVSGMVPGGLAKKLKEKGAVGFLTVHGGYYDDEVIAKGPRIRTLPAEANVDLPGLSVHMRDARDLVCEHLGEDVSLTILSDRFHLNPQYISQLFRNEIGVNFLAYLTNIRIEKAKKLLLSTPLSVAEVAERAGYGDYRVFTKVFKKSEGVTPSQYRREFLDSADTNT